MFKSGYTLRLFRILEDDVVDFLTYIPLEYYLPNFTPTSDNENLKKLFFLRQ